MLFLPPCVGFTAHKLCVCGRIGNHDKHALTLLMPIESMCTFAAACTPLLLALAASPFITCSAAQPLGDDAAAQSTVARGQRRKEWRREGRTAVRCTRAVCSAGWI